MCVDLVASQAEELWDDLVAYTKQSTVPNIFINGGHVGGFSDLKTLDTSGHLDKMLKSYQRD